MITICNNLILMGKRVEEQHWPWVHRSCWYGRCWMSLNNAEAKSLKIISLCKIILDCLHSQPWAGALAALLTLIRHKRQLTKAYIFFTTGGNMHFLCSCEGNLPNKWKRKLFSTSHRLFCNFPPLLVSYWWSLYHSASHRVIPSCKSMGESVVLISFRVSSQCMCLSP